MDELTRLLLAARSGDPEAAAAFVRGTQAEVWRLCAHLGTRGAADDLTQETYARAFASLRRFAGRSSAGTWLLAIARNVCADAVREAVRSRAHLDASASVGVEDEPAPPAGLPDLGDSVALRAMLGALADDRREAFVLTQLLGLSYAEAADVAGCPIGTIRSRVARAREDLVDAWSAGESARRATS